QQPVVSSPKECEPGGPEGWPALFCRKRQGVTSLGGHACGVEGGHELSVLGTGDALLKDLMYAGQVAVNERLGVKPHPWNGVALVDAVLQLQRLILALSKNGPIDSAVQDAPDDVLADRIAAIDSLLVAQVQTGGACRDLARQLGGLGEISIGIDQRLAAAVWVDE